MTRQTASLDALAGFRQRATWSLVSLMAVMAALMMIIDGSNGAWHFVVIEGAGLATVPVLFWLLRRGRVTMVGHLCMGILMLVVLSGMFAGSGLWGTSFTHLLIVIIVSGLLLGERGLLLWTSISVSVFVPLVYGHLSGWVVPVDYDPGDAVWRASEIGMILCIAATAMFWVQRLQADTIARLQEEVAERRRAEQAARAAGEAKARFLATMSHELRTPLNGIMGAARLAEQAEEPQEQRELLGMVRSSADLMLGLINGVLDYSRMSAGHLSVAREPVSLRPLLAEVAAPLALLASQKGVLLHTSIDPSLPAWLCGDAVRLRQILVNLVGNAVKFTAEGEVQVSAQVLPDARWQLVVSDTGVGIAPEALPELFAPFSQADASTTRQHGGTGLGLAIVHRIVEGMRGEISVESSPGRGTTFRVQLPLEATDAPAASPALGSDSRSLRVLVVDDHPINRLVVCRLLHSAGHRCEAVADGHEAIQAAQRGGWDAVLMDCQMPRLDGYDATAAIRALSAPLGRVRIIGLSANAMDGDRERALAAGMDDYLTKPVSPEALQAALMLVLWEEQAECG